ncbi:TPA: hypothetical protein ACHA2H_002225, partial [Enterococcus faecium]
WNSINFIEISYKYSFFFVAKNFEKRQKIKKEILRKKRVIPSVSFLFKKLKTFLFCLENMG